MMGGNYLREGQSVSAIKEELLFGRPRSVRTGMTAQIKTPQGHIAMTVTTIKEHTQEATILVQTGGKDHDSQKFLRANTARNFGPFLQKLFQTSQQTT